MITTHHDLNNIPQEYTEKAKCGFWVAEAIGQPPTPKNSENKIEIIREEDDINIQPLRTLSSSKSMESKIIGTIAITVKNDPDLREPPNSVAWLRRMAVAKSFQRLGIGSVLTDVALGTTFILFFLSNKLPQNINIFSRTLLGGQFQSG